MNYYNPYFYTMPITNTPKIGIFSRLFGKSGISFSGILNGTQRALNFANQAIPLIKEVRPMIGNAKTMFKVMNEFKRVEKPVQNNNVKEKQNNNYIENTNEISNINDIENATYENNGPTFFM